MGPSSSPHADEEVLDRFFQCGLRAALTDLGLKPIVASAASTALTWEKLRDRRWCYSRLLLREGSDVLASIGKVLVDLCDISPVDLSNTLQWIAWKRLVDLGADPTLASSVASQISEVTPELERLMFAVREDPVSLFRQVNAGSGASAGQAQGGASFDLQGDIVSAILESLVRSRLVEVEAGRSLTEEAAAAMNAQKWSRSSFLYTRPSSRRKATTKY